MKKNLFCQILVLIILSGSLWVSRSFSGDNLRLWILPFESSSTAANGPQLSDGITELLEVFLSQTQSITIIDRTALEGVLKEQHLSLALLKQTAQQVQIGKLLNASTMITGSVRQEASAITINAHMIDILTGKLIDSVEVKDDAADVAGAARKLALFIQKTLRTHSPDSLPSADPDKSPMANLHLMKGLSLFYAARYNQAIGEFIQASTEPAARPLARFWMAKSYLIQSQYRSAYLELRTLANDPVLMDKMPEINTMLKKCSDHLSAADINLLEPGNLKP